MVSVSSEVSAILTKGEPNHELKGGRLSRNRPAALGTFTGFLSVALERAP
jgi:hypothetical protein